MLPRAVKRLLLLASASTLVGCLSPPSEQQVERRFKHEHPTCTVQSVSHTMTRSPGSTIDDKAVFRITYTEPGDARPHTYERKFGRVAEGWIEVPSKVPQP
jgi:hypothetical protein